jgi:hypothetical protein
MALHAIKRKEGLIRFVANLQRFHVSAFHQNACGRASHTYTQRYLLKLWPYPDFFGTS